MATLSAQTPTEPAAPVGLRLSEEDFNLFRRYIGECAGIRVADTKRLLLQNRLGKRVRALGMGSFRSYYRFLKSTEGQQRELGQFWSAVTTNETHFFREPHHFEVLQQDLLPRLLAARACGKHLRVWSAACSTGQEVYTLAIILHEFLSHHPGWRFTIIGSDIDAEVLKVANSGAYPLELKREVPSKYLLKYFDTQDNRLQVRSVLRERVSFRQHNLAEVEPLRPRVDIIFCRNAIMYLGRPTRVRLAEVFRDSLLEGGSLLLGSAESFHGLPRIFHHHRINRSLVYQRISKREAARG